MEYRDLGLSVKWATCNLGASSPTESGDYFAWGETSPKSEFTDDNYKFTITEFEFSKYYCELNFDDEKAVKPDFINQLEPEDGAATALLGEGWRIPTDAEMLELLRNCKINLVENEEFEGLELIGPNGNKIFLPAAGQHLVHKNTDTFSEVVGNYWTSGLSTDSFDAHALWFYELNLEWGSNGRSDGLSIRPVYCK